MKRPEKVQTFMDEEYISDSICTAVQSHIRMLESKLPPEPEEVWEKEKNISGDQLAFLTISRVHINHRCHHPSHAPRLRQIYRYEK